MLDPMKPTFSHLHDALLGFVGTLATILGTVASWQEHLEWGLRITSLIVGIAVGAATIWSLTRRTK